MKKIFFIRKPFYVLLMPLFMAVLCEEVDDAPCGFVEFERFDITIENTQASYDTNEVIWFEAAASSVLENECNASETEIVTDAELFRDSFFVLKLVDSATDINSEIANPSVSYDIGTEFSFNTCDEAVNILPILSNDELEYHFRLGLSLGTPGDYVIAIGRRAATTFNSGTNVNANIYNAYNNGENTIKFDSCDAVFTRTLDTGLYFFSIQ